MIPLFAYHLKQWHFVRLVSWEKVQRDCDALVMMPVQQSSLGSNFVSFMTLQSQHVTWHGTTNFKVQFESCWHMRSSLGDWKLHKWYQVCTSTLGTWWPWREPYISLNPVGALIRANKPYLIRQKRVWHVNEVPFCQSQSACCQDNIEPWWNQTDIFHWTKCPERWSQRSKWKSVLRESAKRPRNLWASYQADVIENRGCMTTELAGKLIWLAYHLVDPAHT